MTTCKTRAEIPAFSQDAGVLPDQSLHDQPLHDQPMLHPLLRVFDIQRFAIHDGDGIRTTIFLKGCPLACKWCQNPEGMDVGQKPVWSQKECIGCRSCVHAAKEGEVTWDESARRPRFHASKDDFADIMDACPANAIRLLVHSYTPAQLVDKVKEDAIFYGTEGGVTFSGGEPLLQAAALKDALQAMKQAGFHTAIETSLMADWSNIEPLLEDLDQIHADLKIMSDDLHLQMTGVSNARILENLQRLLQSEHAYKVIIRTPLIPGITDTRENIRAIASFLAALRPQTPYELLAWNPLASAKYPLAEKEWVLEQGLRKQSHDEILALRQEALSCGLKQVITD